MAGPRPTYLPQNVLTALVDRTLSLRVEETPTGPLIIWLPLVDGADRLGVVGIHTRSPGRLAAAALPDAGGRPGHGDHVEARVQRPVMEGQDDVLTDDATILLLEWLPNGSG
ncbi:hypothetical protein [Streptomyces lydicus]|uniref:hypothetical protein n=1 Tax=Streptomyces lydicus TaxID=47763 RepID=UPI0037B24207